jgi:hypothetical protein
MANLLHLKSLEIKRFRAFEHLRIERLGRVNLIVGKNNVGKTSLLEALWLYSNQGYPAIIWKILEGRDEGRRPRISDRRDLPDLSGVVKYLFYGRRKVNREIGSIEIGPVDETAPTLAISLAWDNQLKLALFDQDPGILGFNVQMGAFVALYRFDGPGVRLSDADVSSSVFMSAGGLNHREVGGLWDKIALTRFEEDVISGLGIITPDITRVSFVSSNQLREWDRTPMAKIRGEDDPVPLRSLGEGMNRLLGLTLALVNASERTLLIDEIESGLHYSVQSSVWSLVFEIARRLNIQVFATTHSWDCITAFQDAAKQYEQGEGMLIRLVERKEKIAVDLFNGQELSIITREGIEIR